jgi:preprotein translocase subunit SecG
MTDRMTMWLTVTFIALLVLLSLLTTVFGEPTDRVPEISTP